ncbi:MAG TPA: hypothetical protein DF296_00290 [Candidatus Margulisbacteria bacterium]|nr:MAG: hypothetical protein A2X43_11880 [Candidatus Margulisbacteria bacterium GWD2_39_127]OGI01838.1 MAG: hypothetical protein A2X42_04405 [Candidatus Margulisbacteria bacterium GWF2_38_17]OGI10160.1 MAG: hypothetical protein A2X41_01125 [Candidatus Margulisbacteria bacterium GWE2_39_32]HAR63826.1 hypothetical protein [Candidatus Margulisiibacteriota bacterium]HCT83621.1 hypothetical protein [Candidatus Margulisiibacteriota bacterium]
MATKGNIKSFVIILAFIILGAPVVLAERMPGNMEVAFMNYYYDYKEDLVLPYKSTESGWLPGMRLVVNNYFGLPEYNEEWNSLNNPETHDLIYWRFNFEFTNANTKYDGSTQSGVPALGETANEFLTFDGVLGKSIITSDDFDVKVYGGIGFRQWQRALPGFTEVYSWKYVPLGILTEYNINEKFTLITDVTLKIMFGGNIKIKYSNPYFNEPEGILGNKPGWRIQSALNYAWFEGVSMDFVPWYEYSAIRESTVFEVKYTDVYEYQAYEPSSVTHQYGFDIAMKFRI